MLRYKQDVGGSSYRRVFLYGIKVGSVESYGYRLGWVAWAPDGRQEQGFKTRAKAAEYLVRLAIRW